jgi:hypothetical protein
MDSLLSLVVEAHGGLDRWSAVNAMLVHTTVSGVFWERKGQGGILGDVTFGIDPRYQRVTITPFAGAGTASDYDGATDSIAIRTTDGKVVQQHGNVRQSFDGFDRTSKWDAFQAGYFISYGMWNYMTEPFMLTYPGVEAREIEPWEEDGQRWRRLHVVLPRTTTTHNAEQVFYFDESGMQHRMDYAPEVNGNVLVAQYQYDPKTFDGIVVPTRRVVRLRSESGIADMSTGSILIDIHNVEYS